MPSGWNNKRTSPSPLRNAQWQIVQVRIIWLVASRTSSFCARVKKHWHGTQRDPQKRTTTKKKQCRNKVKGRKRLLATTQTSKRAKREEKKWRHVKRHCSERIKRDGAGIPSNGKVGHVTHPRQPTPHLARNNTHSARSSVHLDGRCLLSWLLLALGTRRQ